MIFKIHYHVPMPLPPLHPLQLHTHTPFGLFWFLKYLSFGKKLPIRTTHCTFLKSRHLEVTKDSYYVLFPKVRQKKVLAHGIH